MKLPKLLDCTLRDGGYINGWQFSHAFAENLCRCASAAGVDVIELGFIDPGEDDPTPWMNLAQDVVETLRKSISGDTKLAAMINFGSVPFDEIPESKDLGIDIIRVATAQSKAPEATAYAAKLSEKGYQATINYMGVSNYSNEEVVSLLDLINQFEHSIEYFYVADSFGSLLPSRTREIFRVLRFGTKARLGFHPHNNLQLAFANCLEAIDAGVDIVDSSVYGMGRGAGNLFTEAIIAYYESRDPVKYSLRPILQFVDMFMEPMKAQFDWGYSLPQLISGAYRCHPNYPTFLLEEKAFTADDIYLMLKFLPDDQRARFSEATLSTIKTNHLVNLARSSDIRISQGLHGACKHSGGKALIVCGGSSVSENCETLKRFVEQEQLTVVSVNNPQPPLCANFVFFGNRRRLLQNHTRIDKEAEVILSPEITPETAAQAGVAGASRINVLKAIEASSVADRFQNWIPGNSATEAILGLIQVGFTKLYLCGLDGYGGEGDYYYDEKDLLEGDDTIARVNLEINAELERALSVTHEMGADFKIITPTRFAKFYSNQTIEGSHD